MFQLFKASALSFLFLIPGLAFTAFGCLCDLASPCVAYQRAQVVFVGKVLAGSTKNERTNPVTRVLESFESGDTLFEVEEAFKGVTTQRLTLFVDRAEDTSCVWDGLKRGERYLVFGYEQNGKLSISSCSLTAQVIPDHELALRPPPSPDNYFAKPGLRYVFWEAHDAIQFYRSWVKPGNAGCVCIVTRLAGDPKAGIKIALENQNGARFESVTNEDGVCTITNLQPGKYKLLPEFLPGVTLSFPSTIEVKERQCLEVEAKASTQKPGKK